ATRLTVRGQQLGTRIEVDLAPDKQTRSDGGGQHVTVLGCDTVRLGELLPTASVDALVADLPYGVQHGSRAGGRWQRSPRDVLAAAAPGWRRLLRDGAGLALAVNRRPPAVAAAAGLPRLRPRGAFPHRAARSIDPDVLLAVPTSHPRVEQLTALAADQEDHTP